MIAVVTLPMISANIIFVFHDKVFNITDTLIRA